MDNDIYFTFLLLKTSCILCLHWPCHLLVPSSLIELPVLVYDAGSFQLGSLSNVMSRDCIMQSIYLPIYYLKQDEKYQKQHSRAQQNGAM